MLVLNCSEKAGDNCGINKLQKFVANPVFNQYRGIRISPYQRRANTTIYATGKESEAYIFDNSDWSLINAPMQFDSIEMASAITRIQLLKELGIAAFISDSTKSVIYTNCHDSTFAEIKKVNPNYYDKTFDGKKESLPYRYVLLSIFADSLSSRKIFERYNRVHALRSIGDNWFYFRSQDYPRR